MSCSKDSGVSVVIAFVIILTIIALSVGMWALWGIPAQIREANEVHAVYVTDSMTDYKVMLQNMHKDEFKNLNVSTIIPVGYSYSSGTMILNRTSVGTLSYIRNDAVTPYTVWSQDVNRFTLILGSGTVIGYEGGGVFRSDDGNYVWSVYPSIYFGKIENNPNKLGVFAGNISYITGDISVGVSGDISVNTRYISPNVKTPVSVQNNTITMKYVGEDAGLWYSAFYEAYSRYTFSNPNEKCDANLTVNLPQISDNTVTMSVVSYNNGYEITPFLSGYTYNAGLVPDYVVKEADIADDIVVDIVVDGVGYNYKNKVSGDGIIEFVELINANPGTDYKFTKGSVYQIGDNHYVAISNRIINEHDLSASGSLENFIIGLIPSEFIKINIDENGYSGYLYTSSDIENGDWKGPNYPSKGSLFMDGDNLYIDTILASNKWNPSTSVASSDNWLLI